MNLFTIYQRVQKLGGFNAIADNRVWKNLFEDLSESGKSIVQGMTKRRYERILLPFERHEKELRENGGTRSELTISTISKNSVRRDSQQTQEKRRPEPAVEIIPLRNGAVKNVELSMDYNSSNDGMSVPVHVIVRPSANGLLDTSKRRAFENERMPGSSRSFVGGQKENIPLLLQNATTIMPLTREGIPAIVELVDSDDGDENSQNLGQQNAKKQKLDILREGGLEVTPISRKAQTESLLLPYPPARQISMQPNVSLMSLTPVRAPPVIQSLNMYQSTSQVFKNPKEDVINAAKNSKSYCLDLTSKKQQQDYQQHQQHSQRSKGNQLSIEEVQRNYRGSNPDLQITLVKPHLESPSSSTMNSGSTSRNRQSQKPYNNARNVPSQPPMNPVLNELQKLQHLHMPSLLPFLSGVVDITPQPKTNQPTLDQSQALSAYLAALYGQNILPNMPAVEFLKQFSNNRIPSSKN